MKKITLYALAAYYSTLAVAGEPGNVAGLSVSQIVEKIVAARGGLEAWRKVESMVWVGYIESANAPVPSMPFILEMKRPNKTRFEVKAQSPSLRMFDGSHGWKVRPKSNGKPDVQPFTPDELSFAQDGQSIDGQLMDYQAKGIAVALDGTDVVEGRKAYRLNVKMPSGNSHHVWIDAQTFLDIKYDRQFRNSLGQLNTVSVFNRNYQTIEGLQLPFTIESGTDITRQSDKMMIDRIVLNQPLPDRMFAKPGVSKTANVDIGTSLPLRSTIRSGSFLQSGIPNPGSASMPDTGLTK